MHGETVEYNCFAIVVSKAYVFSVVASRNGYIAHLKASEFDFFILYFLGIQSLEYIYSLGIGESAAFSFLLPRA